MSHAMDALSEHLHSFLLKMAHEPDSVPHQTEHYMEHLLHLLSADDEADFTSYYGLFGEARKSVEELARQRGISPGDMESRLLANLRRIAVTPEWEWIKSQERI